MDIADYPLHTLLKTLRLAVGLSQAELARRLCVTTGTFTLTRHEIGRWEQGRVRPGAWMCALAQVLDVDVEVLLNAPSRRGVVRKGNADDHHERNELLRRTLIAKGMATALPAAFGLAGGQRALEALAIMGGNTSRTAIESLGQLVDHYAATLSVRPPAEVYDELLAVRSFANKLFGRVPIGRQQTDLSIAAGWLSTLLAMTACDIGEHAATHIWCSDADRWSCETRHPEMSAWATLTRSIMAFYQNQPQRSAELASLGQQLVPMGAVSHARLASQEMRASALAGDADRMVDARRNAARAIAHLPGDVPLIGAFSISLAADPPYTATSTMLIGEYREAILATERVITTVHRPEANRRGDNPSGHARALLILALAHLGAGNIDDALCAGQQALTNSRPAWPTMALARMLDRAFVKRVGDSRETDEFHARFRDQVGSTALE